MGFYQQSLIFEICIYIAWRIDGKKSTLKGGRTECRNKETG